MKYTFYNIVIASFFSCSFAYGMAADEQSSSGESQAEQEDLFEWNALPSELQKKILWLVMEDAIPEDQVINFMRPKGPYETFFKFTPGGDTYAAIQLDRHVNKKLQVYDTDTGRKKWDSSNYTLTINGELLACSDNRIAIFCSSDKIRAYDIHTGKKIGKGIQVSGFSRYKSVRFGQWDLKGKQVACVIDDSIVICDIDLRLVSKFMPEKGVFDIAWHSSGNQIAASSQQAISIYTVAAGKKEHGELVRTVRIPVTYNKFTWIPARDQFLLDGYGCHGDFLFLCDANTGETQKRLHKVNSESIWWNSSVSLAGDQVFFMQTDPFRGGEIDLDLQKHWKKQCDQSSFAYTYKKRIPQKSRWKKMRDTAKRLVSVHMHQNYDSKKINPLYVAALVSRLSDVKGRFKTRSGEPLYSQKVKLSAEEQMIFASLPKELQKRFKAGIRLKDGFKIPWGESLYGNDPVAEDCIVELDDTDSDAASEEQMGNKQDVSDSDV